MRLYAILDRTSGRLLGAGKHPSYTEFEDELPPRLFTTRAGAINAMRAWRQGHWRTGVEFDATDEYGNGNYVPTVPVPLDSPANAQLQSKRQAMDIVVGEVTIWFKLP